MTRHVFGIDGGGTKTQAAIVDDIRRVCGVGIGGPANYDDADLEACTVRKRHPRCGTTALQRDRGQLVLTSRDVSVAACMRLRMVNCWRSSKISRSCHALQDNR